MLIHEKIISHEQQRLITIYIKLLQEHNQKINLVSRNLNFNINADFFEDFENFLFLQRNCIKNTANSTEYNNKLVELEIKYDTNTIMYHIINAGQIINIINTINITAKIADIGSGNGLPGIILAILGCNNITLIESNLKKAAFLNTTINQLQLNIEVINKPVQECRNSEFNILVSRAFSSKISLFKAIANISHEHLIILKAKEFELETLYVNSKKIKRPLETNGFGSKIIKCY